MELHYFNIQKFCLHDGPGIRSTVFLKGCPLRCLWCHNPESQNPFPELLFSASKCVACGRCLGLCDARSIDVKAARLIYDREKCAACGKCEKVCSHYVNSLKGKSDSVDDILKEIAKDRSFYEKSGGGMTVSGGEPSMQSEGVIELISKAKEIGIGSAMETCGIGSPQFYRECAGLGCIFLFDIKGVDDEKHKKNTGVGVEKIHANLDMLISLGARVIIRMPLIPGHNDTDDDLRLLAAFLRERKDGIEYAEIMPYHDLGNEKRRNLGMIADDTIPNGKDFTNRWQALLEPSEVEIRISGS